MEDYAAPAPVATRDEAPWPFPRRLIALFTSPKALFEHLEQRPSWFVPLLVTLVLVAVYVVTLWNPVILPNMLARFEEKDAPQNMVAYGSETFEAKDFVRTGLLLTAVAFVLVMLLGATYWRWLGYT